MDVRNQIHEMKLAAPTMAASSIESRNRALALVAEALEAKRDAIFSANERDLAAAAEAGVAATVQKRLRFDEGKLADCIEGLRQLAALEDPVGRVLLARELDEGLVLRRVTCPIGVIGVIFEARPDALVQISSLCIKSGNCAVLKGGRETANTNRVLFETIRAAAVEAGLPESALLQAELHSEIDELLGCDEDVDLLIPRGSNEFVRYIMEHTRIPVMGHSSGVCHVYVDADADLASTRPSATRRRRCSSTARWRGSSCRAWPQRWARRAPAFAALPRCVLFSAAWRASSPWRRWRTRSSRPSTATTS